MKIESFHEELFGLFERSNIFVYSIVATHSSQVKYKFSRSLLLLSSANSMQHSMPLLCRCPGFIVKYLTKALLLGSNGSGRWEVNKQTIRMTLFLNDRKLFVTRFLMAQFP